MLKDSACFCKERHGDFIELTAWINHFLKKQYKTTKATLNNLDEHFQLAFLSCHQLCRTFLKEEMPSVWGSMQAGFTVDSRMLSAHRAQTCSEETGGFFSPKLAPELAPEPIPSSILLLVQQQTFYQLNRHWHYEFIRLSW